ncbi:phosphoglycerate dehydrogenase [Aliihoeflea aestuarii]|uniref:2-hydroxyacid dehydrogenase n=1 Tax=Aliihoeflea aestuarii TaxID=453840 RepID=UPI0020931A88|nr:2-hydroxyacid dehydrogenase [Aliihoeflea aestuarii]MCO6389577.1 phosphoglycerate dehydrogenase [Aliihoeflea aestuarii]
MTNIVIHGETAAIYAQDFKAALKADARVDILPDALETQADISAYRQADVLIGNRFGAAMPLPERALLYQVCAAGYDKIDLDRLPAQLAVCNCFGHGDAIAEYVMAAILLRQVPIAQSHAALKEGDWTHRAGTRSTLRREIGDMTIGLLGYGHIGKAIARRAKAFGMKVHAANRSIIAEAGDVDRYFPMNALADFYGGCDFVVVSLPLNEQTEGLVDAAAFASMKPDATIINVGRGPVIDEQALFSALKEGVIGGAVIDTWYRYPGPGETTGRPATLPFETLPNIIMTPHNSAWSTGLVRRRGQEMAANVDALLSGQPLNDLVRAARLEQAN